MKDNKKPIPLAVKQLYAKAIMMGVALILLAAALIFFTTAWYTKMVSTAGVSLQAARWDYTANHSIEAIQVNVNEYTSIKNPNDTEENKGAAAPGTAGWIPITLGAQQSNTDIQYILTVDRSTMSEEFQKRIFFYYLKDNVKYYLGGAPVETDQTAENMTGTIPAGGKVSVEVRWEWLYEAPADSDQKTKDDWDEFDTRVGTNPDQYTKDMNATVTIVGVEVNPKDHLVTNNAGN